MSRVSRNGRGKGVEPVERVVRDLRVHPFNLRVYGRPDDGLKESLESFGLQHPIAVAPQGGILSGARRWTAAKALGWERIATFVPDIDFASEAAVEKYVLLANAYRKAKPTYVQKKEADAYYRLLKNGGLGKNELVAIAMQKGKTVGQADGQDVEPAKLASLAAGMDHSTYYFYEYVVDGAGRKAIDAARKEGHISADQSRALKRDLATAAEELITDRVGAKTADHAARARLRNAIAANSYTASQRRAKEANDAALDAHRKGKAFLNALAVIRTKRYSKNLDERHALMIAGLSTEIMEALEVLSEKIENEHEVIRA